MSLITIDYRDRKLIYEQLVDNIKELILRGDLKVDDHLPSVRALAKDLGINPNTIQKAYAELERQGVIATLPGRGSIILSGSAAVADAGREALKEEMVPMILKAVSLGMNESDFTALAAECWQMHKKAGGKENSV